MLRYAITDRTRAAAGPSSQEDELLRHVVQLAEAGVDYIQLRERDIEAGALLSLGRRLMTALRGRANSPKLLVNSRADVAIAAGADGVHLTSAAGSLTPAQIRTLYASAGLPEPVVSVSCHTLEEIASARAAAATLILFGPVFEKVIAAQHDDLTGESRVAEGVGLSQLHLACVAASPTPVLALGGVTEENAAATLEAGATGIAAIRLFSH